MPKGPKDRRSPTNLKNILIYLLTKENSDIKIDFARTFKDYYYAYSLVYEKYYQKGLISVSQKAFFQKERLVKLFLTQHPVVIVRDNHSLLATATLVFSEETVLPCQYAYPIQVKKLIASGRSIVEFTRLAARGNLYSLLRMFRFLFRYVKARQIDDILIEVHPRHAKLYQHIFFFKTLGSLTKLSNLNDAPAVLCRLNLENIETQIKNFFSDKALNSFYYQFFFKKNFPEDIKILQTLMHCKQFCYQNTFNILL